MFENIGETLKFVAKITFCLAIVAGVILIFGGIHQFYQGSQYEYIGAADKALGISKMVTGILSLVGGCLSGLVLFGFGTIIEDIKDMKNEQSALTNFIIQSNKESGTKRCEKCGAKINKDCTTCNICGAQV